MEPLEYAKLAIAEIYEILSNISASEIQILMDAILSADRIFVSGAGRSLLVMRAFAMRLMHLGFSTYVVGDVTTPAIKEQDLLVIASASGETKTLTVIEQRAQAAGAGTVLMTANAKSSLGEVSGISVIVPGATDKVAGCFQSKQPAGNSFEQSLFLLNDGIIMSLAQKKGFNPSAGYSNHANLE